MHTEEIFTRVREFFEEIGVADFGLDENGYCCIQLDEVVLNIELDEETERVFLYSAVGEVPAEHRTEFYEMILDADLFHKHTGGATLGLNKDDHTIVMVFSIPADNLEVPALIRLVENFVEQAEKWQEKITGFNENPEAPVPNLELSHSGMLA
jgi:hypothetical protein